MKKKIALVLLALALLVALSACSPDPKLPDNIKVAGQGDQIIFGTPQPQLTDTPTIEPPTMDPDDEAAAAMNEEDVYGELGYDDEAAYAVNTAFAGATPMPLDPIDMPTPTPRPPLQFSYQTYDITRLGISFEAPVGWELDETVADTVLLTQPFEEIRDNYQAFLLVEVHSTGSTPSKSDMKTSVQDILKTLSGGYGEWRQTNTAERTLMGETGIYADYRGVQVDGTIVRGRVHVGFKDKKIIVVHMSCPGGYNEDYTGSVYVKFRNSLKFTK